MHSYSEETVDLPGFRGEVIIRGTLPDGRRVAMSVGTLQVQPGDAQVIRRTEDDLSFPVRIPSMLRQQHYLKLEGEMLPTAENTPLWEFRVQDLGDHTNGWSDPKDWS